MNTVYFIKAVCAKTKNSFYIRYDLAADDVWVRTYGLKYIPDSDKGKSSTSSSNLDLSNARVGPQYKCPWCGNKRFWKHGNKCGSIVCWDGKNDNVTCPTCNTNCRLGNGSIKTLTGTANSGQ